MADHTLLARLLVMRKAMDRQAGQNTEDEGHEVQLSKASQEELRGGFKEMQADVMNLNADFKGLRADVEEIRTSFKKIQAGVSNFRADRDELRAEVKDLRADFDTLVQCLEHEHPTVVQQLRRERAARIGACLEGVLEQPHLAVRALACAGQLALSSARRASKSVLESCSREGVQEDKLFVAFGNQTHSSHDEVDALLRNGECMSFTSGSWQALPNNYKRAGHAGGVLGGFLYVCGGGGKLGRTVVRLNPARRVARWEQGAPMARARIYPAVAVTRQHLLVCGGEDASQVLSSTERLDPMVGFRSADAWQAMLPMMACRRSFAAVALGDEIMAIGGYDQPGERRHFASIDGARSSEVLAPSVRAWSPLSPMNSPRVDHAASAVNGLAIVCGGQHLGTWQVLQSVEIFDPALQTWSESQNMHLMRPRFNHAAVAVADGLLIIGGCQNDILGTPSENSVEYLDMATGACVELQPMEVRRAAFCAGIISMGPAANS